MSEGNSDTVRFGLHALCMPLAFTSRCIAFLVALLSSLPRGPPVGKMSDDLARLHPASALRLCHSDSIVGAAEIQARLSH